jgi:hypothetical protein
MTSSLDAHDFLRRRARAITAQEKGEPCSKTMWGKSEGCWCILAGPDGQHIDCPQPIAESTYEEPAPFHLPGVTRVPWFGRRG